MTSPVSVEEHLRDILDRVRRIPAARELLLDAQGLRLAEDIAAPMDVPSFDNSAMDGYAVVAADLRLAAPAAPVRLPVVGEIHAGAPGQALEPGTVVRIMTGAPVPEGADAVVPFEQVTEDAGGASFSAPPAVGAHIRLAGSDVRTGQHLLSAGTVLGPRELGLLANVGLREVSTSPRPRVAVLSTGAELTEPGEPLGDGAIYDSNSFLLTAAVRAAGATAHRVHCPSDEPAVFLDALEAQLGRADAVITTGGVSKGTRDVVKAALSDHPRHDVAFRQVAMQPGKPQGFGLLGAHGAPLFALPGNPVSAYVSFILFVEPALRAMAGHGVVERPRRQAELLQPITSTAGKRQFVRGRFDDGRVRPVGAHGSHLMGGLAGANALIVVDEALTEIASGESVPVLLLDGDH